MKMIYTYYQRSILLAIFMTSLVFGSNLKTASAQSLDLGMYYGLRYQVHNLPPTLCQPSGTTVNFDQNNFWLAASTTSYSEYADYVNNLNLPLNVGANHIFESRKEYTIAVDIPAVSWIADNHPIMSYIYGVKNGKYKSGFVYRATDAPPGSVRFNLPVEFDEGHEDSYLFFIIREGDTADNLPDIGVSTIIPITVTGPTVGPDVEIPALDTIVDPQIPYLVLHAPPGDGSSSSFVKDKTTCQRIENKIASSQSHAADLAVKIGVAGQVGCFFTTEFEFSVTVSTGLTIQDKSISSDAYETCINVSEGFSTSSLTNTEGGGDIFIGYGSDLMLAAYELVLIDYENCSVYRDSALIYARIPNSDRKFVYTSEGIQTEINNLQDMVEDTLNFDVRARNNFQNQIDVWRQVLEMNLANINNPDNQVLESVSFNNSSTQEHKSSIKVVESNTIEYEYFIESNTGIKSVIEVGGSGVTGGYEFKASRTLGETRNQNTTNAEVVSYTLKDDDPGDFFNVDILQDPMYGTPIFKVQPGTKSSCPYQGGYQRDQPYLTFDDDSQNLTLSDIPNGTAGTFVLNICNNSTDARTYYLKGNPATNLSGAEIEGLGNNLFSNNDLGVEFWMIPPESCIEDAVISIKQTNPDILDYENIELYLYSECQPSHLPIASSVFLNAHFDEATPVVDLQDKKGDLRIVPNPSSGIFKVRFDEGVASGQLSLIDMTGRLLHQQIVEAGSELVEVHQSGLSAGVYMLVFESEEHRSVQKLIVER